MHVDRKLNLVIPIEDESGKTRAYIHATPIGKEVFEHFFLVIAKTFSEIYSQNLNMMAATRVAALMLRKTAKDFDADGKTAAEVETGLFAEIFRRANYIAPSDSGWVPIPYAEAKKNGALSDDEINEVENALVFFTVASVMHRKNELLVMLAGVAALYGGQIVSSSSTEFATSLATSTPDANTGAKATR